MKGKELHGFVCVRKVTKADEVKEVKEIEEVKEKRERTRSGIEMGGFGDENTGNGSMRLARE